MEQEKVWDAIAEKWAEFRVKPDKDVGDFLDGKRGRVLDLGCGSGRHGPGNLGLGVRSLEGLNFYGVDFSEKLLGFARDKGYVEVKKGFCYDVDYEDGFFDYVFFARVLHCVDSVERRRKSLEEVYRVLKVGGEALITSWGRGSERVKNREKEGFLPWSVGEVLVERYTYIYDFDELKAELEEVGFEILESWENENVGFVVGKR